MAKCVFCHSATGGHDDTCPMEIHTTWGTGSGPWPELARNLLEAWQRDTSVYDRGTPKNVTDLEELWSVMEAALDRGEPEVAMAHLFTFHGGSALVEASHRGAPEQGPAGEGISEGLPTEGPT